MTASFADQEIWHVMIARDDLKRMNVEQLDDAFRLDIVDASTLVWKNGMDKWRRLGSIAGIDDEPETIARVPARPFGPPAAPPPPRPRPQPRSVAPVNPFAVTAAPVNPFASTTPYTSNTPAAVFNAPQLLAPVATAPVLYAPDPYAMPKRRVKLDSSDLNFHGKPLRWGRWLFAFTLLTAGVLAAYRQGYLHEGARRIGLENKYLYGEKRAVGWVTAKAPGAVQAALRQLKLLPSQSAAALTAPVAVAAPVAAPATEPVKASAPSTTTASDPSLKTVSLDSLPVLGAEPEPAAKPEAAAPAPKARAVAHSEPTPKAAAKPRKQAAAEDDEPAPKPAKAKAKAEPAPEPKPEPKVAKGPPSTMSTPLKAAIWAAMQEDAKKGK